MNYTAIYLVSLKNKILDNLGNRVPNVYYLKGNSPFVFKPTNIECDILEKNKKKNKEPIIKKIVDMKELNALGFTMCSVPIAKEHIWKGRQKNMLIIVRIGGPESKMYKCNEIISNRSGDLHHVLYDEANLRLKLVGPRAGPLGEGPWIETEENH